MYRLFLTTASTGSNTPFVHELPNGETALVYQTLLQAYNDANDSGDIIQPAPPGTPGFCFYDASGEPLSTVCVNLESNWTLNKSITLQGDWCRLRLDGCGTKWATINGTCALTDVDFVNFAPFDRYFIGPINATRCLFANIVIGSQNSFYGANSFVECAFVGARSSFSGLKLFGNGSTMTRCTIYGFGNAYTKTTSGSVCSFYGTTFTGATEQNPTGDSVVLTADADRLPSTHCVAPPPDDCDSVSDWSAWTSWDLRLKSTSPYATGGTSVASGQKVYDLAGMPRKVGGARGAYECLADVTHYARQFIPAWYTFERDSDAAPILVWCAFGKTFSGINTFNAYFDRTITVAQQRSATSSWLNAYASGRNGTVGISAATGRQFRATSDGDSYCTLTFYADSPPEGAIPCKFGFEGNRVWQTSAGGNVAAPTSTSVCYVGENAAFASTGASVGKAYVGGWTRVKLGDANIGELVLGLNAEATTTGKVTIKNQTATSAEIFSQLKPTAPAEVTFKECAISDQASE